MNRLEELLIRWQDGALTPDEADEMARLLEGADARAALVEDFFTRQTLREVLGGAAARRPVRRRIWWVAAAAAMAAGLGLYVLVPRKAESIAHVVRVRGTARLTDGEPVAAGRLLYSGQGLETVGAASAITVQFPDGTRLDLGPATLLERVEEGDAGKRVSVARGIADATVSRQPAGRPMAFTTPQGEATVKGTTLRLVVEPGARGSTRLEVTEGSVRLKRAQDGKTVDVLAGHFAVAATGVELAPRPMLSAKTVALVARMAPNSWLSVPDTKMRQVVPDPQKYPKIQGVSGAMSVVSSWSGGALDTRRHQLLVWGGGTSSYYGNELYAFRLDTLAWERLTEPTVEPTLGKQLNHDGTPAGRSTYNGLAYVAHADRLFATGGAIAANAGNVGADITWTFDRESRRWIDMKPSGARPITQAQNFCAYDPATRKVWWFDGSGFYSYDIDANRWTKHTSDILYDLTCAVDTKRGLLVAAGQRQVVAVDLRAGSPAVQTWKTSGGDAFIAGRVGLDYDSAADRIVGWGGGAVYALDPDTKVWTAHDAPGAPKPTVAGMYGRWRYVPGLDAFVVVTGVDVDVHFYKFGR